MVTSSDSYHSGCNLTLLQVVPAQATTILDVGCGEGRLGAALKENRPDRIVYGIEQHDKAAAKAAKCLDDVYVLDVTQDDPLLVPESLDCIIFGDILEHLIDPEAVLRRYRRFLKPDGIVLASIPNAQHHSLLAALLSGDFQYTDSGLLDTTHLRFFTSSTILKLFLDAGYAPAIASTIDLPAPPAFIRATESLLMQLRIDRARFAAAINTYQYIIRATQLKGTDENEKLTPLSFVVCVSDDAVLNANLLASPCLKSGSPHEVIPIYGAASAAAGLNYGLEQAKNDLVICVHQDVYLPRGWDRQLVQQYKSAEKALGPIGVAGVYGTDKVVTDGIKLAAQRLGQVIDRSQLLKEDIALPTSAMTLDELLLVLPRTTPLRFETELGFHFYGADICLQAREQRLAVAVLDALCLHNSRSFALPNSFFSSAATFAHRWETHLPLATPCAIVDRDKKLFLLENTPANGGAAPSKMLLNPPVSLGVRDQLASIIVPCWNQLEFTRICLQALFSHTAMPWELIVIDNGSTDDTATYLANLRQSASVPMTVISNKNNLGFPAAVNQGLRAARGEYLVLLNNDVLVTDGWLEQLVALVQMQMQPAEGPALSSMTSIGMAGPMSNYASPPQLIENVPYRDVSIGLDNFARQWRGQHRGQWFTASKLSAFCLLMKRSVYQAVGGLDERFGLGFFDDDDLSLRVKRAGFELAVAKDLFVHHFGSRSFIGGGIDTNALLDENNKLFMDKWGANARTGQRMSLRGWQTGVSPTDSMPDEYDDSIPDPAHRAKVSLTMIVRNEEKNLPSCLESVRNLFDEIVIVDTGSTDRTKEIAREFGARVIDFTWIDDFAAARNVALENATGDYALWLDADDVIEAPEREKLAARLARLRTDRKAAYVLRCACDPSSDGSGGETVVDHIRLFPLLKEVRWQYRVHEQILPALRQAGIPVRWTDITVRHTGYIDRNLRSQKLERDTAILLKELDERPEDPFILFNLGAVAIEREAWSQALDYLRRSLRRSAPTDSITRKLFALIARAHQMMGNTVAALDVCTEGLSIEADDAELWFRKAVVHRHRGEVNDAETCWRYILGLKRPQQFCSIDQGIYGHLTRRNLAMLARERGDNAESERLWLAVLSECPGDAEAMQQLIETRKLAVAVRS